MNSIILHPSLKNKFALDYEPERDDYLNWKDDWIQVPKWIDGTNTSLSDDDFYWHKNGLLHRDDDKPAVISEHALEWYQNGVLHRKNDKPALVLDTGFREWYKNGQLHRDHDRPALIANYSRKQWYKNGKEYFPEVSIIKAIKFEDLYIKEYIEETPPTYTFQKALLEINPSWIHLFGKKINKDIKKEYEGLLDLGSLGL